MNLWLVTQLLLMFLVKFAHMQGTITTIAGTGTASYGGDGVQASSATINSPRGIVVDNSYNVYFSDGGNLRIRKITSSTGIITTFAGTGSASYSGDKIPATSANLQLPNGLSIDTSGNVYFCDDDLQRAFVVSSTTGYILNIAGDGNQGYNGDSIQATSASINDPAGIAVDGSYNVYISDQSNSRIRKVTASTGVITTIAGTGVAGYSGNGGPATSAAIQYPCGINLDNNLNVYFGDHGGYNVIRKITVSTGVITTVAGTGSTTGGYNGDSIQATSATLYYPYDVVIDSSGNLFICDMYNYRVRKVDVSTGVITTVVGTGVALSTGDGSAATAAAVKTPIFSRYDSAGNYYITEFVGARVRKVINPTVMPTALPSAIPSKCPTVIPRYYLLFHFMFLQCLTLSK